MIIAKSALPLTEGAFYMSCAFSAPSAILFSWQVDIVFRSSLCRNSGSKYTVARIAAVPIRSHPLTLQNYSVITL
jgi:hypothetical protein